VQGWQSFKDLDVGFNDPVQENILMPFGSFRHTIKIITNSWCLK